MQLMLDGMSVAHPYLASGKRLSEKDEIFGGGKDTLGLKEEELFLSRYYGHCRLTCSNTAYCF